jgi:hypothetical protein
VNSDEKKKNGNTDTTKVRKNIKSRATAAREEALLSEL